MNTRVIVIGIVTVVLLGLYIYAMVLEVKCADEVGEALKTCREGIDKTVWGMLFTAVGALIAAVAVTILAVSNPEDGLPTGGLENAAANKKDVAAILGKVIPLVIISIWIVGGVIAIIFGSKSSGSPALTEMGKAWVGTAVAGVGAFLGIRPNTGASGGAG